MRLIYLTILPLVVLSACDAPPLETIPGAGSSNVPGLRVATQDMPALCRAEAADKFAAFGAAFSLQPAVPVSTGWVVNGIYRRSGGEVPIACNFNQDGALVSISDLPTDPFQPVEIAENTDSAF